MNAPLARHLSCDAATGDVAPDPCKAAEITVFSSFEDAEPVWREFEARADLYAFQCFDWLANWYRFIGRHGGTELCIVAVEIPKGEMALLLPLGIQRGRGVSRLVWLGKGVADYQGPVIGRDFSNTVTQDQFAGLWKKIRGRLPHFDVVFLDRQPAIIGDQANPFSSLACRPFSSDAHFTRLDGSYDPYYKSKRGKKSRETDRRKQRRIQDAGEVELVMPSRREDIARIVETMISQKSRWYDEMGVRNVFDEKGRVDFYSHMATHYVDTSFVHLSALRQGEEILATNLGLVFRDRFYYLMPTYYDGELKRFSPGVWLLRHLFQWCFERKIDVFDFTTGDETYKYDWCEAQLGLRFHIEAATVPGKVYAGVFLLSEGLKSRLRQSPALFDLAKKVSRACTPRASR